MTEECFIYLEREVDMYTIPITRMPRPKPEGPQKTFQLRLKGDDAERWLKIWHTAKERNHYINETQVNRILLGLDEVNEAVTERDRAFFQGTKKPIKARMVGRGASGKPHISEVSPQSKRK